MKRILLLLTTIITFPCQAQLKIITVEHSGTTSIYNNMDSAVAHAVNGDDLYLSGGTFTFSGNIPKGLNIYGAGFFPDSTLVTLPTIITTSASNFVISGSNANNLMITGILFSGNSLVINGSNITITRCQFSNCSISIQNGNNTNIVGCVIGALSLLHSATNLEVKNCIIHATSPDISAGAVFENNVFFPAASGSIQLGSIFYSIFRNNIFYLTGPLYNFYNFQGNSYFNNVFTDTVINASSTNFQNNLQNKSLNTIFQNIPYLTSFLYTSNYHLKSGSPAIGAGINGTDAGIFGGVNPFKEGAVPSNPHIQKFNAASITDEIGNLRINATIRAQNDSMNNVITACRYWVDTATSKRQIIYFQHPAQQTYVFRLFNFSNFDTGKHIVYYQFKDTTQAWSSVVADSFINTISRPRIDYITPNKGGNGGDITISIYGRGFFERVLLRLTKAGYPDIILPDSVLKYYTGQRIDARLNLRKQAVGAWNFVVEIPGDTVMILNNGFSIEPAIDGRLVVSIVGPGTIRRNTDQAYSIVMENVGNNDANQPVVWIYTPPATVMEMVIKDSLYSGPYALSPNTPITVLSDTSDGTMATPIIPRSVAPGATAQLRITVNTNSTQPFNVEVGTTRPMNLVGPEKKQSPTDCMLTGAGLIFKLLGETIAADAVGCFQNMYGVFEGPFKVINNEDVELWSYSKALVGMFTDCGSLLNPEAIGLKAIVRLSKAEEILISAEFADDFREDCLPLFLPDDKAKSPLQPVAAIDPNAKYGALGFGPTHFVNPVSSNPYLIAFENDAVASASAQVVKVTDILDTFVFDKSTFELGSIKIGGKTIEIPPGSKHFTDYVDYRPEGNYVILRIEAGINDTTGIATWLFTTLDPETERPTVNPVAGFLPPNINSPEGQGSVFFTIKTKHGLPTNTVIQNKASIYFDNNDPIVTAPWINTIDVSTPHSEVAKLPEYTKDTIVHVSWSGGDPGSGIRHYTIYVSQNGNPNKIWKYQTTETAADFIGKWDSSYAFHSIATDNVGNVEEAPATYDAITHLIRPGQDITNGISVYPNPTSGTFTIQGMSSEDQDIPISVTNVTGQSVLRDVIDNNNKQSFKKMLDLSMFPKGYYTVTLRSGKWSQSFKVVKL